MIPCNKNSRLLSTIMMMMMVTTTLSATSENQISCTWSASSTGPPITAGSEVDLSARYGFLPTSVAYPAPSTTDDSLPIDLAAARAPEAFIDSIQWDNPACFSFQGSSKDNAGSVKVVDFEGSAQALQEQAFRYNGIIMNSFIGTDNLLAEYVSASTPTWNTTYYNNVRNDLISRGSSGGCVGPTFQVTEKNYGDLVLGSFPPSAECQVFSDAFVTAYNSLPETLAGNEQSYLDFCATYGFRYPLILRFGSRDASFIVTDGSGVETSYSLGHTGKMYFTENDCATPEVASFSTGGWDEMLDHPAAEFSEVVAANFATFYETYPVSAQPVRELNVMKEEQLPTYAPPPLEACVLPPTMPPTPEPTKSPTVKVDSGGFQPSPNGPVPAPGSSPTDGSSSSAIIVSQQWTVQTTAVMTIGGALVLVL